MTELVLISLLVSLLFAAICGFIAARRKGRWLYWSIMGFIFGPFAIPFAFAAKTRPTP